MPAELGRVLDFSLSVLGDFGFQAVDVELSVHDPNDIEHYAGDMAAWALAEQTLAAVVAAAGLPYRTVPGEAAFYGPKIDLKLRDALDRPWQLSTIQFDFWLPQVFELSYTANDGSARRPYMIHRALLGSLERFAAVLIEHYKGAFPDWLAPVQVVVASITDRQQEYAAQIAEQLSRQGLRVEVDDSSDRIGNKIRKAEQTRKPPYILVVGDREQRDGLVAVRRRGGEDRGAMSVEAFMALVEEPPDVRRAALA